MSEKLEIRFAGIEDAESIAKMGRITFKETYGKTNPKESVEDYINTMYTAEKIRTEMDTNGELFIVSFLEKKAVGFAKLRDTKIPKGITGKSGIEIQRIYVLKEHQGERVGKELKDFCIDFARQKKYDLIWLEVWQKNNGAIQFYQKSGFVVYETTEFVFGNEVRQDFLLKKELYY